MPKATTSTKPIRFELQSCPPDGFVELRRMKHGERLHRQDISMNIMATQDQRTRTAEMNIMPTQTRVAEYEFACCIVNHNLEDDNGDLIDFTNARQVAELDGRIGEEISAHIDTLHDWQATLPNSEQKSTVPSTVVTDHSTDQSTQTMLESRHKQ